MPAGRIRIDSWDVAPNGTLSEFPDGLPRRAPSLGTPRERRAVTPSRRMSCAAVAFTLLPFLRAPPTSGAGDRIGSTPSGRDPRPDRDPPEPSPPPPRRRSAGLRPHRRARPRARRRRGPDGRRGGWSYWRAGGRRSVRVHYVEIPSLGLRALVRRDPLFRTCDVGKALGANVAAGGGSTTFRVFAPRADSVRLWLYREAGDEPSEARRMVDMSRDADGVWEATEAGDLRRHLVRLHGARPRRSRGTGSTRPTRCTSPTRTPA